MFSGVLKGVGYFLWLRVWVLGAGELKDLEF